MNNTELFSDENSSKLVQKLDNLTINLGKDNQDVLNIDSSVYVNNIERQIPDEFKTTDKKGIDAGGLPLPHPHYPYSLAASQGT